MKARDKQTVGAPRSEPARAYGRQQAAAFVAWLAAKVEVKAEVEVETEAEDGWTQEAWYEAAYSG